MTMVVDASVALGWFFKDERNAAVDALLSRATTLGMHVPMHWPLEMTNAFRIAIRRGRFDEPARAVAIEELQRMPIYFDQETQHHAWHATMRLSDRHGLTPYDAAYLELAQRLRLPLATLDAQLKTAAIEAAVEIA